MSKSNVAVTTTRPIIKKGDFANIIKNSKKQKIAKTARKEEKIVKRKGKLTPPPEPMLSLGGIENPIVENRGLKRALTVAIVEQFKDKEGNVNELKAGLIIRASGILFKQGYTKETPTDELTTSEWSGVPYVRFVTRKTEGQVYSTKHPEKVSKCLPFAKELIKAVKTGE